MCELSEPPGSQKALARSLQARGFAPCRLGKNAARGYAGLRLTDGTHDRLMAEAYAQGFGRKF